MTLDLAAFSLDASRNPSISPDQINWVAVIVNANDKPFLAKRFPQGRWYWLEKFSSTTNQPQMLAVLPWDSRTAPTLRHWIEANQKLKPFTEAVIDSLPGRPQKPLLDKLFETYPAFQGDPFLESCFWEKMVFHYKADHNPEGVLRALQTGLQRGYPLPQFFNDEGFLLAQRGEKMEARKAFLAALHAPVNFTPAAENLKALDGP